jgi:hypothetical protein
MTPKREAVANEQRYEQSFNVGKTAELTLRNVRGNIEVSGWDRPEISVVAVKRMGSEWGARESFEDSYVEMEQDGQHVRVRTRRPNGGGLFGWIGIGRTPPRVDYTIKVPATSHVSVRNVDGRIAASDIIGNVYARTVNGRIELKRISGQIITSVVDADVHGTELGGTLATKAVSGSVAVAQSQLSSLWAKSVSGSVRAETTIDPNGSYETGSVDGSFHLMVPRDSRISASMTSVSGTATCTLPNQVSEHSHRHWRATINGGGASVALRTVSGSLSIAETSKLANAVPPAPSIATEAAAPASGDWPEMAILKSVERGELTVEQALAKLADLDKGG